MFYILFPSNYLLLSLIDYLTKNTNFTFMISCLKQRISLSVDLADRVFVSRINFFSLNLIILTNNEFTA